MHAYVFIGPRWWGFSHDEDGANLPIDLGPWSFFRNALIADGLDDGDDDREIAAQLTQRGYGILARDR